MVIPQVAVVKLQNKQQVFKVQPDSTATAIEVTTEDVGNGEDYVVTSGLNVGDKIGASRAWKHSSHCTLPSYFDRICVRNCSSKSLRMTHTILPKPA